MLCLGYSLVLGRLCRGSFWHLWLWWGVSLLSSPARAAETRVCLGVSIGREHSFEPAGGHGLSYWAGVLWREGVPCTVCVDLIVRPVTPVFTALPWWREGLQHESALSQWFGAVLSLMASWGGLLLCSFPVEVPQCEILLSKGFCSSLSSLESYMVLVCVQHRNASHWKHCVSLQW